jgi:hypothetical protein
MHEPPLRCDCPVHPIVVQGGAKHRGGVNVVGHSAIPYALRLYAQGMHAARTVCGRALLRTIMGAMPKPGRKTAAPPASEKLAPVKRRKAVPYEFVLDALFHLPIESRSMFGCLALYVGDKIVLMLREKHTQTEDNGVWLATTKEHHQSLCHEFPHMRSIQLLGKEVTGWQVLPADAPDFESAALRACELIVARDPRIGKIPKSRRR